MVAPKSPPGLPFAAFTVTATNAIAMSIFTYLFYRVLGIVPLEVYCMLFIGDKPNTRLRSVLQHKVSIMFRSGGIVGIIFHRRPPASFHFGSLGPHEPDVRRRLVSQRFTLCEHFETSCHNAPLEEVADPG